MSNVFTPVNDQELEERRARLNIEMQDGKELINIDSDDDQPVTTPGTPPTESPITEPQDPSGESTSPSKYFAQDYRPGQNVADYFKMKPQKYVPSVTRRDAPGNVIAPASASDSPRGTNVVLTYIRHY